MNDVLYKRIRPDNFNDVIGQEEAIATIKGFGKRKQVPQCILFVGPSGCGKTTIARILKDKLKCGDADFTEINAATANGVDMVRDIQKRCGMAAISGNVRVWIIDECHQLTTPAQNAFLKLLEDPPSHVYFFLATTDPRKIIKTVKTRATEIVLKEVPEDVLEKYIDETAVGEGIEINEEICEAIARAADGSVRKALVILDQILSIDGMDAKLEAVSRADAKRQSIELCRALMAKKIDWKTVTGIIKDLEEEPESLRYMVLGYANSVLLKSGNGRAADIIRCFQYNFYESKKAGLTLACWDVYQGAK